jgi:hypothetical protein
MRSASLAASGAVDAVNTAKGTVRMPASSAPYPRTNWKYCVTTKTKPKRAKKANVTATLPAVKRRLVNTETSSIGCVRLRSQATKTAAAPAARAKPPVVTGEVQPCSGASMMVNTRVPIARVDRTSPTTSTGGVAGSREVGTNKAPPTKVTAATGAMATKTLPHQKCSSSQPPVTGPRATPRPVMAPHTPMARARSPRSVYRLEMIDRVDGKISAAPTPITARTAISAPAVSTNPPTAVAHPNTANPVSRAPLRP